MGESERRGGNTAFPLDMSVIGCCFWSKERNVGRGRLNSSIQQWMLCITYVRTYVEGGRCAC